MVEGLLSLRGQIDAVIQGLANLYLSAEPPPQLPPMSTRFRTVVERLDPAPLASPRPSEALRAKVPQLRPDSFSGMNAWEACEAYLLHRGKPALTAEIAVALEHHGFQSTSKNLRGFVYQALRKKPDVFTHPDQGSWGLKIWG